MPFLIIWDWDRTIANTMHAVRPALNELLHNHGYNDVTDDEFQDVVGTHHGNFWRHYFGDDIEKTLHEYYGYYEKHASDIQLYDGAKDVLQFVHNQHIPQMIASNKNHHTLNYEAKLAQVDTFIECIKGTVDSLGKPDIAFVQEVLDKYNPKKIIVIGDGLSDMQLAQNLGAIGVLTRIYTPEYPHDYYCETFGDIKNLLEKILK